MIISDQFIWLHLPKTGGTSTASLFRELNIPGISVDPDHVDAKHESIEHRLTGVDSINNRTTIVTTRRLASWLLSDWHHKTITMGLNLPFAPTKSGLFYSLRLGGTWVAADYWINYFKATSCDRVVRLEHLQDDSNRIVLPLLPKGTPKLQFPDRNSNQYEREIEQFFSAQDLKRIHCNNPLWSQWEQTIYGNTTEIKPYRRIKAKLNHFSRSIKP